MKMLRAHDVLPQPLSEDDPLRLMTIPEVARELRCSKNHVANLTAGRVRGIRPLPSLTLGRRRLVRQSSLREWIKANEHIQ